MWHILFIVSALIVNNSLYPMEGSSTGNCATPVSRPIQVLIQGNDGNPTPIPLPNNLRSLQPQCLMINNDTLGLDEESISVDLADPNFNAHDLDILNRAVKNRNLILTNHTKLETSQAMYLAFKKLCFEHDAAQPIERQLWIKCALQAISEHRSLVSASENVSVADILGQKERVKLTARCPHARSKQVHKGAILNVDEKKQEPCECDTTQPMKLFNMFYENEMIYKALYSDDTLNLSGLGISDMTGLSNFLRNKGTLQSLNSFTRKGSTKNYFSQAIRKSKEFGYPGSKQLDYLSSLLWRETSAIDLSHNKLTCLDLTQIPRATQQQHLSDQSHSAADDDIDRIVNRCVNVSYNKIDQVVFPEHIPTNGLILTKLNASHNNLTDSQFAVQLRTYAPALTKLNLSYNQFTSFTLPVGPKNHRYEINLSHNPHLTTINLPKNFDPNYYKIKLGCCTNLNQQSKNALFRIFHLLSQQSPFARALTSWEGRGLTVLYSIPILPILAAYHKEILRPTNLSTKALLVPGSIALLSFLTSQKHGLSWTSLLSYLGLSISGGMLASRGLDIAFPVFSTQSKSLLALGAGVATSACIAYSVGKTLLKQDQISGNKRLILSDIPECFHAIPAYATLQGALIELDPVFEKLKPAYRQQSFVQQDPYNSSKKCILVSLSDNNQELTKADITVLSNFLAGYSTLKQCDAKQLERLCLAFDTFNFKSKKTLRFEAMLIKRYGYMAMRENTSISNALRETKIAQKHSCYENGCLPAYAVLSGDKQVQINDLFNKWKPTYLTCNWYRNKETNDHHIKLYENNKDLTEDDLTLLAKLISNPTLVTQCDDVAQIERMLIAFDALFPVPGTQKKACRLFAHTLLSHYKAISSSNDHRIPNNILRIKYEKYLNHNWKKPVQNKTNDENN